ncbi:MAG: hypothetical protein HY301_00855 [Verrucomicrobia bacterium]|nr:hypothetical protein [Verrucomicrobiota bacterium]
MSDIQAIQSVLETTSRRRRWQHGLNGLAQGLVLGGFIWLLALALYKFFPLPIETLLVGGGIAVLATVIAFGLGVARKPGLTESARWLDQRERLQERISTALELSAKPAGAEWQRLLVADAARHVQQIDPRKLLPFQLSRASRWAVLVLALGAGLGFVPEYRSPKFVQQQKDKENIKATGQQLATLARQTLTNRPPVLEAARQSLENSAELGEQLARQPLTRSEALRDLANVSDKLKNELKTFAKDPALKRMEQAARTQSASSGTNPGELQKKIDELQQKLGDKAAQRDALDKFQQKLQQAAKEAAGMAGKDGAANDSAKDQMQKTLSSLAREAKDLGLSASDLEAAMNALAASNNAQVLRELQTAMKDLEKMRDMAKALQQLQQQADQLGKNLAEQLQKGQAEAAMQTLAKMMEQLKSGAISKEELEKLLKEVSQAVDPAKDYGQAAKFLSEAAKQMQAGQKGEASQSLASAASELKKLLDQLGDAQELASMLDALQRAEMAVGTCQSMGSCRKPGVGNGGKPGSGVGTWADEEGWLSANIEMTERWDNTGINRPDMDPRGLTDRGNPNLPDNLKQTKVRGQLSPGGSMPSITLKGVSIKGASVVQLQEAAAAAQADAQSALNQDKVPRAYQNAVKEYFDDLKK